MTLPTQTSAYVNPSNASGVRTAIPIGLENCDCDCAMLLQLLSKGELLAHVPRGLEADLAPKPQRTPE